MHILYWNGLMDLYPIGNDVHTHAHIRDGGTKDTSNDRDNHSVMRVPIQE